ncbi:MAG: hypothetical protein FJ030_12700 [Chloroflexi bacterium]|nr:hypothetical protein [Chloroflexota bacterium]
MSIRGMNQLIGKALISDTARGWALNGKRADLLQQCELDADEVANIMSIKAHTLEEFSAAVHAIYVGRKEELSE